MIIARKLFHSTFKPLALRFNSFLLNNSKFSTENSSKLVCAYNEWDPIEEIIIGRPDYAVIPKLDVLVKACIAPDKWGFFEKHAGQYWVDVIPEDWKKLITQLENFVRICEFEGIKVERTDSFNFKRQFSNPNFTTEGFYNAMPRDILIVIGDEIIQSTMAWRQRAFEYQSYAQIKKHYEQHGVKWVVAPQPKFSPELYNENFEQEIKINKEGVYATTEYEACFDAADFLRAGKHVFAQRSQVTNKKGIDWMRQYLAPKGIKVVEVEFHDPRPMHVDSTMNLVKPGCVIRNPDRPLKDESLFLKSGWKFVDAPRPEPEILKNNFYMSSEWVIINTLMRSPDSVFVEEKAKGLQEMYKKIGVKPIPVSILNMNSIGGGFHCWTTDIRRKGKLEQYFID